jgi:hypothetical protein
VLLARRQYAAAAADAAEAERILAPNYDASQWRMAMAMNAQGAALSGLRRFPEAEVLLLKSLGGLSSSPMQGAEAKGRQRLAALYTSWGKPARASEYLPH